MFLFAFANLLFAVVFLGCGIWQTKQARGDFDRDVFETYGAYLDDAFSEDANNLTYSKRRRIWLISYVKRDGQSMLQSLRFYS